MNKDTNGYRLTSMFLNVENSYREEYFQECIGMIVGIIMGVPDDQVAERDDYILRMDMSYLISQPIASKVHHAWQWRRES